MIKIIFTIIILLFVLCIQVNTVGRIVIFGERYAQTIDSLMKLEVYNELNLESKAIEMIRISASIQEQQAIQYYSDQDYSNAVLKYYRAASSHKESHNIIKSIELYTLAAPLFEQAAIENQKDQDYKNAAWNYQCAANVYKEADNIIKYIEMLQQASQAYEQQAIECSTEKDYSSTARNYKKTANIYRELGNRSKAIVLYTNIAKIYIENGYSDDAVIIQSVIKELKRQNSIINFINNHYHHVLLGSPLTILAILIDCFIIYIK